MKPEWKEILIDSGAEFDPEREHEVASFGNVIRERRATLGGTVICDLSHIGLIQAYGEETAAFLQGQFTNNIEEVSATHSQLTAYCTPKGRALATFRAFQRENTLYLTVACDLLEDTLKRLRMFVMRSKVTLEDGNDALVRFGISGNTAEEELTQALGGFPAEVDDVQLLKGITAIRIPGPSPRFELYGELDEMSKLWETLNVRCAPVGANSWRLLDILAGIPTVSLGTKEAYVPQMMNYELIGGVSFKKGCYTGQEVVARMHYLGAPKRRMYRIHFDTDDIPAPGTKLFTNTDDNEQSIGSIVMGAAHPDGGVETLAVILIKYADGSQPVLLGSSEGIPGKVHLPPYDFPAEKS
jgi:folate-binding protein YgfZ